MAQIFLDSKNGVWTDGYNEIVIDSEIYPSLKNTSPSTVTEHGRELVDIVTKYALLGFSFKIKRIGTSANRAEYLASFVTNIKTDTVTIVSMSTTIGDTNPLTFESRTCTVNSTGNTVVSYIGKTGVNS